MNERKKTKAELAKADAIAGLTIELLKEVPTLSIAEARDTVEWMVDGGKSRQQNEDHDRDLSDIKRRKKE